MKDWTGNYKSVYTTLGASNHTNKEREENDYYATEPRATELLLEVEKFSPDIWECACGSGEISKVLEDNGYNVKSTDIVYRGFGEEQSIDFLNSKENTYDGDIITNPPFKYALEFCQKALSIISNGHKVAMFLKLQFLEGKKRKSFFLDNPPKTIYVSSSRLLCAKNADFQRMRDGGGSAVAYAWYVWEKGYKGNTVIKWIN